MTVQSTGCAIIAAAAVLVGASAAVADDGDQLALPNAVATEELSQATARGEVEVGAASGDVDVHVSSSATAEATIDHVTIVGPSSTGNVSGLADLLGGADVATMQISTGSGNIQQGVSAVALAF